MELLDRITDYLIDNELKLATAESCTAGLIVSELARVPGAVRASTAASASTRPNRSIVTSGSASTPLNATG
nr:CinA family protein [Halomonas antri]